MPVTPVTATIAAQFSDATFDKLLNAGLPTLAIIVAIMVLAVLAPVMWYLTRRDAKRDEMSSRILDQWGEERKDNRVLIEQQGIMLKQNGETLENLKQQTELNVQRNLIQMQQSVDIKSIAESNTRMAGVAQSMAVQVQGFADVKDAAIADINEHTTTSTNGVTEAMNRAFEEMFKQIAEVRGMVERLGQQSTADVRAILERIDSIQHVADTLPDTGSLEGKVATGSDAHRPPLDVNIVGTPANPLVPPASSEGTQP